MTREKLNNGLFALVFICLTSSALSAPGPANPLPEAKDLHQIAEKYRHKDDQNLNQEQLDKNTQMTIRIVKGMLKQAASKGSLKFVIQIDLRGHFISFLSCHQAQELGGGVACIDLHPDLWGPDGSAIYRNRSLWTIDRDALIRDLRAKKFKVREDFTSNTSAPKRDGEFDEPLTPLQDSALIVEW